MIVTNQHHLISLIQYFFGENMHRMLNQNKDCKFGYNAVSNEILN
jgi:hypothetical protein